MEEEGAQAKGTYPSDTLVKVWCVVLQICFFNKAVGVLLGSRRRRLEIVMFFHSLPLEETAFQSYGRI